MIECEQNILIIGGTGTLGKGLTQKILKSNPLQEICIFSRDEVKQLDMMDDFPNEKHPNLEFVLGDIRDKERLLEACSQKDVVINAAAIKHVVMAEKNPSECYKTNVTGTKNLVESCHENHVAKCLLISTDKAIEPSGVYGKSKKDAEDLVLDVNGKFDGKYSIVRFGNILGSRASVSEVFKKMAISGSLKITDENATRFGLQIDAAVDFLLAKIGEMNGGEIFTPKMKSFKVIDLAKAIDPNSKLEIVGLRPGDKLHEVILDDDGHRVCSSEVKKMNQSDLVQALDA